MKRPFVLLAALAALLLVAMGCSAPRAGAQAEPTPTATPLVQGEQHPWIGVVLRQLSAEEAAKHSLGDSAAVVIVEVAKDGPAAMAGLQPKDILVSIGGTPIATIQEVVAIVKHAQVGDTLSVIVMRGEQKQQVPVQVVVGPHPKRGPGIGGLPHRGLPYGTLPGLLPDMLGLVAPELRDLGKVAPKDRFEHFLGGEFSVLDSSGQQVRVQVLPGAVAGVEGTTLAFTPNGSSTATSLTIGQDVPILNLGRKLALADLKPGDKVVVLLVNGQIRLVSVGAEVFAPMLGPWPGGIPWMDMPRHPGMRDDHKGLSRWPAADTAPAFPGSGL